MHIEGLRDARKNCSKHKIRDDAHAMVVPKPSLVKKYGGTERLATIFIAAGLIGENPDAQCVLGVNMDRLNARERFVYTSNRNFEEGQGRSERTNLTRFPMTNLHRHHRLSNAVVIGLYAQAFAY